MDDECALDEGTEHANRSKQWIESLAAKLLCHEQSHANRSDIRSFSRGEESSDVGLNEYLHDICIACVGSTLARNGKTDLPTIRKPLWQVESEFSSSIKEAVKDFNKLLLGNANNKLFIGPYLGKSPQAMKARSTYVEMLKEVLCDAEITTAENWYLGLVPHPERWRKPEIKRVCVWSFDFDLGCWTKP